MDTKFAAILAAAAVLTSRPAQPERPAAPEGLASDPVGVYALLDRVELLPNADAPTSVRMHGAFAIAVGPGEFCTTPAFGALLFGPDDKPDECVKQWRELATLAGRPDVIGFSSRHGQADVRLLRPGEPEKAGRYSTWMGLQRVEGVDYGPVRELRLLPKPVAPLAAEAAERGRDGRRTPREVKFTVTNCLGEQAGLRYVFGVETSAGECVASGEVPPGDGSTSWSTQLCLLAGDRVTWRAHVAGKDVARAPVATVTFEVGPAARR